MGGNVNQTGGAITPGFPNQPSVVDNTQPAGKSPDKPVRSVQSGSQLPKLKGKEKKRRRLEDYSVKKDNDSTRRRKARGLIHRLENMTERAGATNVRQRAMTLMGELQNLDYALRRLRQEQNGRPADARKLANLEDASKYLKRQEGSLTIYTSKKTGAEFIPYDTQYAMELKPGMVLRTTYGDVLKQGCQLYCSSVKQRLIFVDNSAGKTVEIVKDNWRCDQSLAIESKYLQHQLARLNEKVLQLEGRQDKHHYPSGAVPIEPFEDRSRYQQVLFDDRPDIRVFVSRNTGKQYVAYDLQRVVPLKPDTITSTRYGDICRRESVYVVSGKGEQLVREEGHLFAVELPDAESAKAHPMAIGKEKLRKQAGKLPSPELDRADQAPIQKETMIRSPNQEKPSFRKQGNEARKAPEKPLPKAVNPPDQLSSEKIPYSQSREKVKEQAHPIAHSEPSRPATTTSLRPRQGHTVERQKAKAPEVTAEQKSKVGSQASRVPVVEPKKLKPDAGKKGSPLGDGRTQQTAAQRTKPAADARQKREANKPAVKRKAVKIPSDQPPVKQKKPMARPSGTRRIDDFAKSGSLKSTSYKGYEHFRFFQAEGSNRNYVGYDDNWAVALVPGYITPTRYGQVYLSEDGQLCLTGPGGRFYEKNGEILLETPSEPAPDTPAGSIPIDQMNSSALFSASELVGEGLTLLASKKTGKTYVSYDQKSAIEYKEGEIVQTRFGDFCKINGDCLLAEKGSVLIKRDGEVCQVKDALRETISRLKNKKLTARDKLDQLFNNYSKALFVENAVALDRGRVSEFLTSYEQAIQDEVKVKASKTPEKKDRRLKAIQHLKDFVAGIDDQDERATELLTIAIQCAGRLRERNLVQQTGLPYCGVYSVAQACWASEPARMVLHTLDLALDFYGDDTGVRQQAFPKDFVLSDKNGPMADQLVVASFMRDKMNQSQSGTHFEEDQLFLDKFNIPYQSIPFAQGQQQVPLIVQTSLEEKRTGQRRASNGPQHTFQMQIELLRKLSRATQAGASVRASATPKCAQALSKLSEQYQAKQSRKAIPTRDFMGLLQSSEPAEMGHAVTIDKVKLGPGEREVSLKLYTWGKSYELELPIEGLSEAFASDWHIIGDSAR